MRSFEHTHVHFQRRKDENKPFENVCACVQKIGYIKYYIYIFQCLLSNYTYD